MTTAPDVTAAYASCLALARQHYENFPVASLLLPKEIRPSVAAVYAFARIADDMADEGSHSPEDRLRMLNDWQGKLDRLFAGQPADHPVFAALGDTVQRLAIPRAPFDDLLTAFRWDVTRHSYESFGEIVEYCRHSANPVGTLVLYLFRCATPGRIALSDAICTGLQLANFWQDVGVDLEKGRSYLPLEDLRRFGYTESDLQRRVEDGRFLDLLRFQVDRTWQYFRTGQPLIREVPGTLRLELALTWHGGTTILRMIDRLGYRVLTHRPHLGRREKLSVLSRSMLDLLPWMLRRQP